MVGWLVGIYVALALFQPYRDLKAGNNLSLKFKWRGGESNPGPLAQQANSFNHLATAAPRSLRIKNQMTMHLYLMHTYTETLSWEIPS